MQTRDQYVLASLPLSDLTDYTSATTSIVAALVISWIGLGIEIVGYVDLIQECSSVHHYLILTLDSLKVYSTLEEQSQQV